MISNKPKKVVDWEKIYYNYNYGNDDIPFLIEIFGDLQNEIEMEIKELKKEINFENYKKIQNISHKIKGTLSNFYCEETCDIMCEINDLSKEGISYQSIQKYEGVKYSNEKIHQIQYLFFDFCEKFEYVKKEIKFLSTSKNN